LLAWPDPAEALFWASIAIETEADFFTGDLGAGTPIDIAVRTITLKNPIAIASAISVIAFSWLLLLIVFLRVLAK